MDHWWNDAGRRNMRYSRKTCPVATLYSTNPTRTPVLSNPGLRREDPATYFHRSVNFPLSRVVVVMLNRHSSTDFTNFTPRSRKNWMTGHCSWCSRISGVSV